MKKMRILSAVLLMCTIILASCDARIAESSSSSSQSGDASEVAYRNITQMQATADLSKVAFVENSTRLVVDDGTGERVVYTTQSFWLDGVRWSPDGRYVSFYRVGRDANRELFVWDTLMKGVTESYEEGPLPFDFFGRGDVWSPDSSKVIYYGMGEGGYFKVAAGETVKITPPRKGFYAASFSPDGSRILYCEGDWERGSYLLKTYDVASGTSKEVYEYETFNALTGTSPLWLSDSEVLVFEQMSDKLYRVEVVTGKKSEYLSDIYAGFALSPDRKYLAYSKSKDFELIWVKEIATGVQTELKTESDTPVIPVWSYDSKKVIVSYYDAIRVFGLDGAQVGDTVKLDRHGPGSGKRISDPVFTKDGLWYEGKES